MNFYDFFSFVVRMSFANLLHLCNPPGSCKTDLPVSCSWADHTVWNLIYIRRVALRMESTSLTENRGVLFDIQKIWKDPFFVELFSALNRTYENLYGQSGLNWLDKDAQNNVINHRDLINGVGSVVSSPRSLISLIDCILKDCSPVLGNLLIDDRREEKLASF